MKFRDKVIRDVWNILDGRCQCFCLTHSHLGVCYEPLVWENRGMDKKGGWKTHPRDIDGPGTHTNCEILCTKCYRLVMRSFQASLNRVNVNSKKLNTACSS